MADRNELKSEELKKVSGGTPPELPATQLAESAYKNMFEPCKPIIPDANPDTGK